MNTFFLCLANSKKFGERCIAGIELKKDGKKISAGRKRRKTLLVETYF